MKMERGHWIIAGITVALVGYITLYTPVAGYLSQRQAQAAQAAAEAQESALSEGVANVTTAGSISTGTVLKREGVAVAELWGMKQVGAKAADVVKFTSHDSAERFEEFLQGLRDRETFQLIGHELPTQTALWIDDFNDPVHRLYEVETPDGVTYEFCGWVKRVKTHPPLEGALVFEADVQCTSGPLTREVETTAYYHCYDDIVTVGTPPPDDEDHWEDAPDPPYTFGDTAQGASDSAVSLEFTAGRSITVEYPCIVKAIHAYIYVQDVGMSKSIRGAIYDNGTLLSSVPSVTVEPGAGQSVRFPLSSDLLLDPTVYAAVNVILHCEAGPPVCTAYSDPATPTDSPVRLTDTFDFTDPWPDPATVGALVHDPSIWLEVEPQEWRDDYEYVTCNNVVHTTTTEETYCP